MNEEYIIDSEFTILFSDVVKAIGNTLYISIPHDKAKDINLEKGDTVRIELSIVLTKNGKRIKNKKEVDVKTWVAGMI